MKKSFLFVFAALVLAGLGAYYTHQNATEAHRQADNIVQLDQNPTPAPPGQDVASATQTLKDYVKTHMGATVTYTLSGSYNRALAAAKAAEAAQSATSQVYADAQRACSGKSDSITQARCNQNYISQHLVNQPSPAPVVEPKTSDYTYTLHAPLWTSDLAGALFLGAAAALAIAVFAGRRRRY